MSRQQAKDSRITVDAIYDDMNASMPVGAIVAFGGSVAPAGWHLCDGSAHGSSALQSVIGSANTPDLRSRFIVGAGSAYANGATGGADTVKLTAAQSGVPSHSHGITDPGHQHGLYQISGEGGAFAPNYSAGNAVAAFAVTVSNTTGITVDSSTPADASQAHENRPPYYALTYIIRKERL